MQGFKDYGEEFVFYSNFNGEPWNISAEECSDTFFGMIISWTPRTQKLTVTNDKTPFFEETCSIAENI